MSNQTEPAEWTVAGTAVVPTNSTWAVGAASLHDSSWGGSPYHQVVAGWTSVAVPERLPTPFSSTRLPAKSWASTPPPLTSHPRVLERTTLREPTSRSGMLKPYQHQRQPSMW